MVTNKKLILTFFSFLFFSHLSLAAVNKAPDVNAEKLKKEQLAFNEENMKLTLQNIKKLRAMSEKNTDIIFDKMTEHQNVLNEMRKNTILKSLDGNAVIQKNNELQLEIAQLRLNLNKQYTEEATKLQETIRQRRIQMAKKVGKQNIKTQL